MEDFESLGGLDSPQEATNPYTNSNVIGQVLSSSHGSVGNNSTPLMEAPKIFYTDLPPCGYAAQIAFQNVIERLRQLWFASASKPQTIALILEVCKRVKDELDAEAKAKPVGSLRWKKTRQPWRLEVVFKYELRWAKFFVEEAESLALARSNTWNEMSMDYHHFMVDAHPIPRALRLYGLSREDRRGVEKLWRKWNANRYPEREYPVEQSLQLSGSESGSDDSLATKMPVNSQGNSEMPDVYYDEASHVQTDEQDGMFPDYRLPDSEQ